MKPDKKVRNAFFAAYVGPGLQNDADPSAEAHRSLFLSLSDNVEALLVKLDILGLKSGNFRSTQSRPDAHREDGGVTDPDESILHTGTNDPDDVFNRGKGGQVDSLPSNALDLIDAVELFRQHALTKKRFTTEPFEDVEREVLRARLFGPPGFVSHERHYDGTRYE